MKRTSLTGGLAVVCLLLAPSPFFAYAQDGAATAESSPAAAKADSDGGAKAEKDPQKDGSDKKTSASSVKSRKDKSDVVISGRKRFILKQDASLGQNKALPAPLPWEGKGPDVPHEFVGREIADYRTKSGGRYILEDEFGVLRIVPGDALETIEDGPDTTLGELRQRMQKSLLEEFGDGFSTKVSDGYIFVYDSSDGYAEWCMRLFDSLTDGFADYASHNGFELKDRVEPMVVVIFATKSEFVRYAAKETPVPESIAAYYNMETNRVALYDLSETEGTEYAPTRRRRTYLETKEFLSRPNAAFNVATIVHEATHQIAFNRGLFHRTGPMALWAVEGLSLVFETPNGKASQGGWGYRGTFRTNERQLRLFNEFASRTAQKDPLRELVREEKFMADPQGSYALSWALFYYLYKKRPKELAAYIKDVTSRPPFSVYSPEDRVADFEKHFGDDWEKLTESLVRFVRRL